MTRQVVVKFIKNQLICRYGVPDKIITDNGSNLNNKMMKELCSEFKNQLQTMKVHMLLREPFQAVLCCLQLSMGRISLVL